MPDEKIVVSANAGAIDSLQATGRILLIIASTAPAAAILLKKGDLIGLYNYFQTQPGVALAGALGGLAAALYGIYKSWKRGKQVANVAANPAVPSSVADLK